MNLIKCLDCPKEDDPKNMVGLYRCKPCNSQYCSCGTKYFDNVRYVIWLDGTNVFSELEFCYIHCRKLHEQLRALNCVQTKWTVKEIKNLKVTALNIEPCSNDPKITADTSSDGAAKDENIITP